MKTRIRSVTQLPSKTAEGYDNKTRNNAMSTALDSPCMNPALDNLHNIMRNKLTMLLGKVSNPEEKIPSSDCEVTPFEFVNVNSEISKSELNAFTTNISISPDCSINDEIIISNILKNDNISELMNEIDISSISKFETLNKSEDEYVEVEINDSHELIFANSNIVPKKTNTKKNKGRKKIVFADLRQNVIEKCRNGGKILSQNADISNQIPKILQTPDITTIEEEKSPDCSTEKTLPKHPKIIREVMCLRSKEKLLPILSNTKVKDISGKNKQGKRRERRVQNDNTSKQPEEIPSKISNTNQCYICSKSFKNKKETKKHFMFKHNIGKIKSKKLHPCDFCTRKFSCKKVREYHVKHSHSNVITCLNCKKNFLFEYSFNYHLSRCVYKRPKLLKVNKREILFNCILCDSEFVYEVSLKNHIKNVHNKYKYCDKCTSIYHCNKKHTINCRKILQKRNFISKLYELCNFCDKSYPTHTIKKHINWKHKNEIIPKITLVEINEENEIQIIDSDDNLIPENVENVRQVVHCLNCFHDISKVNFFSEHILTCFDQSKLNCPFCCELEFNGDFLHHVKSHVNTNNNEKCFCKLCHKFFVNIYNKNLHALKCHPTENQNFSINNDLLDTKRINFRRIKSSLSSLMNDTNNGQ